MAVEDFDIEAIYLACRAFIKGSVKGRNASFAPSAPELAEECRAQQDRLRWEAHRAANDFVIEGSDDWRRIEIATGNALPVREVVYNGVKTRGWDVPKEQVQEARMIELPKPVARALPPVKTRGLE